MGQGNSSVLGEIAEFIGILFILGIILNTCSLDDSNNQQDTIEHQKPAPEVSARKLFNDYDKNEIAGDKKYGDKVILINGRIDSIGKDITEDPYITFYRGEYEINNVRCMFSDENELLDLSEGDRVKVKGRVSGESIGNVIVRECTLANDLK